MAMGGIVRRDSFGPDSSSVHAQVATADDARRRTRPAWWGHHRDLEMHLMSELFALVLASLPFLLFALLLVETFRDAPTAGDGLPVDLFHRSYGA
jgi:hypothetical protein